MPRVVPLPLPLPMTFVQALGGFPAVFLFVLALAAFVIQSSLTQYVQGDLGFRQPYFLLYMAHGSFTIIFPIHLLYLCTTTGTPLREYFLTLRKALVSRLSASDTEPFPIDRLCILILGLTVGINIPALLWYAAVSLTSISDVTVLWNTNSFWVYVLSSWMYGMQWEFRKLGAVLLATVGVIVDVYGGSTSGGRGESLDSIPDPTNGGMMSLNHEAASLLPSTAPLAGDLLTLIASLAYALYQVLYKRYAALPSDDIAEFHIPQSRPTRPTSLTQTHLHYQSLCNNNPSSIESPSSSSSSSSTTSLLSEQYIKNDTDHEHLELPFGLYPNFLTSCVGLSTAILLGFGIPLLHWASLERFQLPPDTHTALCVAGIALSGLIFNASFMILLGLWGPILTSVGNLLTIVLVIIADFIFNHGAVTIWSLIGAAMIASGFAILALDMIQLK